jgi:hypothetical protein
MRSPRLAAYALAVVLGGASAAPAQEDAARAILERAIKAHGGEERLARVRTDRVKTHGTLFVLKRGVPFTAETTVQLPGQLKNVIELSEPDGKKRTVAHLISGDKVAVLIDGRPEKNIEPAALAEIRDTLLLERVVRLVPLLRDRTFDLAPLEPIRVNDRPAIGIKVTGPKRRELRLYFDKEMGFLVKIEHLLGDGNGKPVREERYFGNFKDVDGCIRPFKVMAFRDGKKILEAEVTEIQHLARLDDSEFTPP